MPNCPLARIQEIKIRSLQMSSVHREMKIDHGTGEMAQWRKELASKSKHLSSIPGNHMVEGENQLSSDLHVHTHSHIHII